MGRSIDPTVWDRWRDRFGRFENSALTVAAFCRSERVSQAGFYQWRKKLGRSAGRQRAVGGQRSHVTGQSAFVRVVPASVASAVVVTLVNGVRVEVPSADHELVGHVVHVAGASAATGGR